MNLPDPMTQDDQAVLDQQDDDLREQRWAQFVSDVKEWGVPRVVRCVSDALTYGRPPRLALEFVLYNFAESYGWPSVLAALARAMRETEQAEAQASDPRRV